MKQLENRILNERAKFIEVDIEQQKRIEYVRKLFSEIYSYMDLQLKPGRETSLAYTKLEEAQFWAIKGITREEKQNENND